MWTKSDLRFMRRAIRLAMRGLGATRPNPAVGAVVVKDGRIVGEGWHRRAGTPHAEVHALEAAGEDARGGTIYVTLEPCNHTGRTPPCTRAILDAGIERVVVGTRDPNPRVQGGGVEFLRSRGLDVRLGCLQQECRRIVAPFAKHFKTGMPWVVSKVAMSLDGKTATRTGHSQWITGLRAREWGHRMRHRCDAILVGKGTVLADDPSLTCRIKGKRGRDPLRIVLDSTLSIPVESTVLKESRVALSDWLSDPTLPHAPTLVAGVEGAPPPGRRAALEAAGASVLLLPGDGSRMVDVHALLEELGRMGIQSVLVEGGATVHGSFWDMGLVDEALFFYGPVVIGGTGARPGIAGRGAATLDTAPRLKAPRRIGLGEDLLVQGLVRDLDTLWH